MWLQEQTFSKGIISEKIVSKSKSNKTFLFMTFLMKKERVKCDQNIETIH